MPVNKGLLTSNSAEWETPQDLFDALDTEFHFTLDPCSTDANAKCAKHYTKEQDGLKQDWTGETVFCNPPMEKNWSSGSGSATGTTLRAVPS